MESGVGIGDRSFSRVAHRQCSTFVIGRAQTVAIERNHVEINSARERFGDLVGGRCTGVPRREVSSGRFHRDERTWDAEFILIRVPPNYGGWVSGIPLRHPT